MADEVVLLDFWASPYGMRVRIALREKAVEFEYREENLMGSKSPLLLEMNPVHKQIPVLIHKGKPVCESGIILHYIDEVWNHKAPFLPSDPYEKSQAKFWADYVDKKIFATGRKVWVASGETQEAAKKELIQCFKLLEVQLGDKAYFGGNSFGIVDISLIPLSCWFYAMEKSAGFSLAEECPKLFAWSQRCKQRESVSKSLADEDKVCEFLMKVRQMMPIN